MKYRTLKCKTTNEIKHVSKLDEKAPDYNAEKYILGGEKTKEELIVLGWEFEDVEL